MSPGPMRSIELILDAESDAAVRADWAALEGAGVPNLSRHSGASNRPHVSLVVGSSLEDSERLREAFVVLPIAVTLASLVVFGTAPRGLVLSRLVTLSRPLLDVHQRVHDVSPSTVDHSQPGMWTPHVTLGSRLTATQLGLAVSLVGAPIEASLVGARLWDPASATITDLSP